MSLLFAAPLPCPPSTLALHDALPISCRRSSHSPSTTSHLKDRLARSTRPTGCSRIRPATPASARTRSATRSEEHTSELQSPCNLVCRLLLEKKNNATTIETGHTVHRH